jgi:ABC-type dipeptide/oligopeptide/nickel transport system permease subunit
MAKNKETKNTNIPEVANDQFEFVQREKKIFDEQFETKPIGYFQDAMIRFTKNKTNIIATVILSIIILMSVFQPLLTTKNYSVVEANLSLLPPRIPILENFGIADGTISYDQQPVDLATIDLETGFAGDPIGNFLPQFIVDDSREYYTNECSLKDPICLGGETVLRLSPGNTRMTVVSTRSFPFTSDQASTLEIHIVELSDNNSKLIAQVQPVADGPWVDLGSFNAVGVQQLDVRQALVNLGITQGFSSPLRLIFESQGTRDLMAMQRVALYSGGSTTPIILDEGTDLSLYSLVSSAGETGTINRRFGEIRLMTFRYRAYDAVFGDRNINAMAKSEYDTIVANNPCNRIENPNNLNGWFFEEGCPIREVIRENPGVIVGGVSYGTYRVVVNYALLQGYPDIPYFLFGTTRAGRDLFTLIWVATRTSLLIGVIVSAINITVGVLFGAISGYYGGAIDMILQRVSEVIGRIPFLVILAIFVATLGGGVQTLIFILIVSGWIGVAYVTRTQFYRFKGREYVLASRTLGAKDMRLIFRHILPNGIGTIITASILLIPATIFAESTISYLGFGIGHGSSFSILGFEFSGVSVGVLLADGRPELLTRPHLTAFPAIVISILMITFNMFGNALRDAFNPQLRGSL